MNLLLFTTTDRSYFIVSRIPRAPKRLINEGWVANLRQKIHDIYESIRHRFDYQENVCVSLRHADKLTLHYSAERNEDNAGKSLNDFLTFRNAKHRRWLIIDIILALFGSLLTPIPGPNVFFFYPAARALSHFLALKGIKRVRAVNFDLNSSILIQQVENSISDLDEVSNETKELEEALDLLDIRDLLEKL